MDQSTEPLRIRNSARVVLLDPDDRVLLLRVEDTSIVNPSQDVPESFWTTIGGGLEPDETFEDAAHREVFEETGISEFVLGPQLWQREMEIELSGKRVLARERYYAGRVAGLDIVFDNVTDLEREVFREHRWWSADEVQHWNHGETLLPPQLPELLRQAIAFRSEH